MQKKELAELQSNSMAWLTDSGNRLNRTLEQHLEIRKPVTVVELGLKGEKGQVYLKILNEF